jgi:peptidyl-prolyl cis-trans isomerase C
MRVNSIGHCYFCPMNIQKITAIVFISVFGLTPPNVAANKVVTQAESPKVVTIWSQGEVTTDDIRAELLRGPAESRASAQADPATVSKLIDGIQLYRELARRAKGAGIQADPLVQRALQLSQEKELGSLYLQQQIQLQIDSLGDLTTVAKEQYLVNVKQYAVPEKRALSHILISNRPRSDAEAKKTAQELRAKIVESPDQFVDLAMSNTDDQGSRQRGGGLGFVSKGSMVKEFEESAFALSKPGQISEVVKTQFGYHIIKLLGIEPPRTLPFDEVKEKIISEIRQRVSNSARDKITREIRNDPTIKVEDNIFEQFTGAKKIK